MIITWTTYFIGDPNYLQQTTTDRNIKRNLIACLFIEHSVNHAVYEAVTSHLLNSDAHQIYQALKDRFNRPSWSSAVFHASSIFKNSLDRLQKINEYAMSVNEAIQNLEHQLGPITSETIATLAIYFAVPSMHQLIMLAINTLMATNTDLKVRPDDLLNMIRQISTALPSFDHSNEIARINATLKFGSKESYSSTNQRPSNKHPPANSRIGSSTRQFDTKTPSSRFPCHYCGEAGYWSPNCPIKAKANEMRSRAHHQPVNVAGTGVVPSLENNEALLDSGATHSVVGNILLFTSLKATDMTLAVASSKSFKVNSIGTIVLHTLYGTMEINKVLYCDNIPGVVISIGHLLNEGFSISFLNNSFTISTLTLKIETSKDHNQWFIPLKSLVDKFSSFEPVNSTMSTITSSTLPIYDHSLL
ncbi:hypothetical protein O181_102908 [Austropuccinia psidii MF-1]|uniref:Retrovirus-related Pol polyprotein from transposon TNT 1-94-like beta-barrel domain-containing protein n=1 Tax=Austropuccinia psidii MF-1 TaxID=1389203 RepID=A0A9Q3PIK1_9BASI|nr:hypothetical protein [Austropuccinia psidii MF-1]